MAAPKSNRFPVQQVFKFTNNRSTPCMFKSSVSLLKPPTMYVLLTNTSQFLLILKKHAVMHRVDVKEAKREKN